MFSVVSVMGGSVEDAWSLEAELADLRSCWGFSFPQRFVPGKGVFPWNVQGVSSQDVWKDYTPKQRKQGLIT